MPVLTYRGELVFSLGAAQMYPWKTELYISRDAYRCMFVNPDDVEILMEFMCDARDVMNGHLPIEEMADVNM